MGKILKLNNDADYYYGRGIDKSEAGGYIEAVDSFYMSLKRDPENLWIYSEIGYNYLALGLYEPALKIYFKILALDKYADIGYLGLMQCFIHENQVATALYYLNMGIDNGALDQEYEAEEQDAPVSERPKLRLLNKNDNSEIVALAKKMIVSGESDFAKQMLSAIPDTSNQYDEAQNHLSFLAYSEGDYDKCISLSEAVISNNPDDLYALTTMMLAYYRKNDFAKTEEIASVIDGLELKNRSEIYRVAMCFMEVGDESRCVKYFEKLFNLCPYERDTTLALAIAYYDTGKTAQARAYMLALRRLYPEDRVVAYYARFIRDGSIKHIPVAVDLPDGEKLRRLHRIEETFSMLSDVEKAVKRLEEDEEFYDMVTWLFSSREVQMCQRVGAFLCQHEKWQPYFRDKLIDPAVPSPVKKEYLLSYLKYSDVKKFALLVGDIMLFFNPRIPKCDDNFDMRETYWLLYATCAFVTKGFQPKINKVYKNFVALMSEPDFKPFKIRVPVMAALIAYKAKIHKIFESEVECCEIFGCTKEDFHDYARKLGLEKAEKETTDETEEQK